MKKLQAQFAEAQAYNSTPYADYETFIEKEVAKLAKAFRAIKARTMEERQAQASLAIYASPLVDGIKDLGTVAHGKGANGTAVKARGGIRLNYRCGYGKWNYAPCILIEC